MDMKPFDMLEQRIQRAAELVELLRKENRSLRKQVGKDSSASDNLKETNSTLKRELSALKKEKAEVRSRVTAILDELEELGLDTEA